MSGALAVPVKERTSLITSPVRYSAAEAGQARRKASRVLGPLAEISPGQLFLGSFTPCRVLPELTTGVCRRCSGWIIRDP
jgi:hypothetical protein